MNRYEKVRLDLEGSIRKVKPAQTFSEVIDEYSKNGYRFKQVFAPTGKSGTPKYYDIIFEKIEDGKEYVYDYLQIEVDHKAKNDLMNGDYWEEVYDYALKGWTFINIFAPASLKGGVPKYYELIFEKELVTNRQSYPMYEEQVTPEYIDYEQIPLPSQQREFVVPTRIEKPIEEPLPLPIIKNDLPIPVLNENNGESNRDMVHNLPVFEEEKLDKYENVPKQSPQQNEESKPFVFKDEITKEVIDKDYAKRFFSQIKKSEEKVPLKAKDTNVGYVEFDDEDE